MKNDTNITEAPVSMNFRLTYKGIDVQFTNREVDVELKPYMDKAKIAIDWALDKGGFVVPEKRTFGAKKEVEYVQGKVCPKCKGRLIKKVTSAGKPYHKCENSKYDFATKQTSGCDFVDWLNPVVDYDKTDPYKDKSKVTTVEAYEENQDYQG